MELTLHNLEKCFYEASKNDVGFVGVKIEMCGFEEPEVIINPNKNFDKKFFYYKNAYNEDLTLKNAPDKVKIVGFTYGNSYEDIRKDLIG